MQRNSAKHITYKVIMMKMDGKAPYGEYSIKPSNEGSDAIFSDMESSGRWLVYLIFPLFLPAAMILFWVQYFLYKDSNILLLVLLSFIVLYAYTKVIRTFLKYYKKKTSLIINPKDKTVILKDKLLLEEIRKEYQYSKARWHIIPYQFHLDIPRIYGAKLCLILPKGNKLFLACSRNVEHIANLAEEYSSITGIRLITQKNADKMPFGNDTLV